MNALMRDEDRHTVADIYAFVRGYFPDASDDECEWHLWEHTSFPLGPDFAKYRRDLERYKATVEAGETPCLHCGRPAHVDYYEHVPTCWDCHNALAVRPA